MIPVQIRWHWRLAAAVAVLCISGCATAMPPHRVSTQVLPSQQFASHEPPEVRVRPANADEVESIAEFTGKKAQERSAAIDSAGSLLLAPALCLFLFPEFLNPVNWHFRQDPRIKESLAQFPGRMTKAIEDSFMSSPIVESRDLLEIVYFADVLTIGPAADRVCFVVHAQITLQSQGTVLYREIIRIDTRAYSDDIEQPDCTQSPDRIQDCADRAIPRMIQTRLPGFPWRATS